MRLSHIVFGALILFLIAATSSLLVGISQEPNSDSTSTASSLDESFDSVIAQAVNSPAEKSQQLATWMAGNNWRELGLARRAQLMRGLVNRSEISNVSSVRWTGAIAAPESGNYTFAALSNERHPGKCRLWINGQLIIDATDIAKVANGEANYVSEPFALTQGDANSLKMEFEYLSFARRPSPADNVSAETVTALLWEADGISRSLVPSEALSPPDGSASGSDTGLRGEYFAESDFQQSLFSRLDATVDLKSLVVAGNNHLAQHKAVRDDCFQTLLSPSFLAEVSADLADGYWKNPAVEEVLEFATTSQRAVYADWLVAHPVVLAADPGRFDRLFDRLATLPGDYRVRVLSAWSADRPLQPIKTGFYPEEYNEGSGYVESIGRWFVGKYADDIKQLATADLKRPNGDCRVELLKVLTHGAVNGIHGGWLRAEVYKQMEGISFNSDARASWLLGIAAMEEIAGGYPVRPNLATPYLQEAMLIAQSDEMRFRVLSQFAPRLISIGHFSDARTLLDQNEDRFTLPDQQAAIARWRSSMDQLERDWGELVAAQKVAQQQAHQARRTAMLRSRLERATQRGDTALAAKYQRWINQSSATN